MAVLAPVVFLFTPSQVFADSPSIKIEKFDVQPRAINYSGDGSSVFASSKLEAAFELSTPNASAVLNQCSSSINSANGDINWFVYDTNRALVVAQGEVAAEAFASDLRESRKIPFSYTPVPDQASANFILRIACKGTVQYYQITESAAIKVDIKGQSAGPVVLKFGSDKTNQKVQTNTTIPVKFMVEITAREVDLKSKCLNAEPPQTLIYSIYQFAASLPTRSNEIFKQTYNFGAFGSGSTQKAEIPLQVNMPGNDLGFILQARCGDRILAKSGQINIYSGGAGTDSGQSGGGGSGSGSGGVGSGGSGGSGGTGPVSATSTRSYSFEITNPLRGGPNDLFDVINIVTKWLLNISIPIAVLFILWAGFLMLTAGPTPAKFDKGKKILVNVVIGLAVIFIGRGFITLIYSIIELGGSNAPVGQGQGAGSFPAGTTVYGCTNVGYCVSSANPDDYKSYTNLSTNPTCNNACSPTGPAGDIGSYCKKDENCDQTAQYKCKNSICQRNSGNFGNEACVKDNNCRSGEFCDLSLKQVIDGKTLGTCAQEDN
ncbi:MAG: hypothetical protein UY36_C0005G0013 [Parcubacteria group bacterium GW2011_GWA1_49_11]|nr:MAG: hypothetical protein UY36_C0005G0013 [Parcubacteria group bacterium GW2011_GWA1_49_11]